MPAAVHRDRMDALRRSLEEHPAARAPLLHATAQFHLGGLLLDDGSLEEAEDAFTAAAALFAARGARPEQAKALNGLGATLRAAGRLDLAARALEHATRGLTAAGLSLEEGAARFNLGLVLRDANRLEPAELELTKARALLDPQGVPAQAAAVAREQGATQLMLGRLDEAEASLRDAIALADAASDDASRSAAANMLGLAQLGLDQVELAVESFKLAAAASPRTVRPEAFAMAKANLATACERADDGERARLAARQAMATPAAPKPVHEQAAQILARLGTSDSDLRAVLELEGSDEVRANTVREELLRTVEANQAQLVADARSWLEAHRSESIQSVDVAAMWLSGLLELPPAGLERVTQAVVQAAQELDQESRDEFRESVTRAMARFHIPQWMRLQDVFVRAAEAAGDSGSWR